jgi:hypothetical protein
MNTGSGIQKFIEVDMQTVMTEIAYAHFQKVGLKLVSKCSGISKLKKSCCWNASNMYVHTDLSFIGA